MACMSLITLSFITKRAFITLSFIIKHPFITLSFSKVNIKKLLISLIISIFAAV